MREYDQVGEGADAVAIGSMARTRRGVAVAVEAPAVVGTGAAGGRSVSPISWHQTIRPRAGLRRKGAAWRGGGLERIGAHATAPLEAPRSTDGGGAPIPAACAGWLEERLEAAGQIVVRMLHVEDMNRPDRSEERY